MSSKAPKRKIDKSKKTRSSRANLKLPVGRVQRLLREGNYAPRVGSGGAMFLTAALEYLCAEMLELSTRVARDLGKQRIQPRHIMLAIEHDDEIKDMLKGVTISSAGVRPHINAVLLPKKTVNSKAAGSLSQEH